ncbi:hypothetical protein BU16DRAFT_524861 [Lophium mytilinum]|uniref:Uncharacterized protein n=1 Tax=Lophium mytilinum TaxID=390894 RepID=A0A6A6R3D7_9PEZI|nr:hypothetical protein BU16DRAFT_524861 [Lophium mytilinum]
MLRVWIFVILASVWLPGAICVGSPDPLTYWIDASMAKRAAARLPPDYSNPYMHEAFVRVFHWLKVTRANEQDPNSQLEPTLEYLKVYREYIQL